MRKSAGAIVSIGASLVLLAVLVWPFFPETNRDIFIYYGSGALNPLLAGVLAIGVIVAFAAINGEYVARDVGAGVVLTLGVSILLVVSVWVVTGRVDVFRAPGWAFPAQRWLLVVLSALIVLGAGWYTWTLGLFTPDR